MAHALAAGDIGDLRIVGLLCDAMIELLGSGRLQPGPGRDHPSPKSWAVHCSTLTDENPAIEMRSSQAMHGPGVAGAPAHPGVGVLGTSRST